MFMGTRNCWWFFKHCFGIFKGLSKPDANGNNTNLVSTLTWECAGPIASSFLMAMSGPPSAWCPTAKLDDLFGNSFALVNHRFTLSQRSFYGSLRANRNSQTFCLWNLFRKQPFKVQFYGVWMAQLVVASILITPLIFASFSSVFCWSPIWLSGAGPKHI